MERIYARWGIAFPMHYDRISRNWPIECQFKRDSVGHLAFPFNLEEAITVPVLKACQI
jgi:hypothetical protein